jgi:hypothetical protein
VDLLECSTSLREIPKEVTPLHHSSPARVIHSLIGIVLLVIGDSKSGLKASRLNILFLIHKTNKTKMTETVVGPAQKPSKTEEEILAAFDSIPLFMKSLPEEDNQDTTLSALQSLIYEGTPDGG